MAVGHLDFDCDSSFADAHEQVDPRAVALVLDCDRRALLREPLGNLTHPPLVGDTTAAEAGGRLDLEAAKKLAAGGGELEEQEPTATAARVDRHLAHQVLLHELLLDAIALPGGETESAVALPRAEERLCCDEVEVVEGELLANERGLGAAVSATEATLSI